MHVAKPDAGVDHTALCKPRNVQSSLSPIQWKLQSNASFCHQTLSACSECFARTITCGCAILWWRHAGGLAGWSTSHVAKIERFQSPRTLRTCHPERCNMLHGRRPGNDAFLFHTNETVSFWGSFEQLLITLAKPRSPASTLKFKDLPSTGWESNIDTLIWTVAWSQFEVDLECTTCCTCKPVWSCHELWLKWQLILQSHACYLGHTLHHMWDWIAVTMQLRHVFEGPTK